MKERLAKIKIGGKDFLTTVETKLMIELLFEFEGAIAFDDTEMGLLDESIEPPIIAHTVPHIPWQQASLRLPKTMQDAVS